MNQTVVAIFSSREKAQAAADDLFDNGFLKENIDVCSGDEYHEGAEGESGITRFFRNLFGTHDEKTERYSRVAKKGYVVAVHTHSEEESLDACEILDDDGAIDVNDHYNKYFILPEERIGLPDEEEVAVKNSNNDVTNIDNHQENDKTTGTSLPLTVEELRIHKKEVQKAGFNVRSRIIEIPATEEVKQRADHVPVEKR